ncbi:dTMP kinase [Niveispirillum sp. SYP-B3756]|uniref:dTMP kinase n=1 Tax=Niveispirillum sp. SYP-B3756 TaxID=2662178 RepID=UPI0012909E73|nr:dTMP kinase [Niveispirillum sp. SYP-B3756]MQP65331.1 dTMP kinase [Niveispirillum sp. SYP-B3756]
MAERGRFITLEGGEGAGKSTQIRLLAEALRADGRQVVITREPGGSPGAEAIRNLLVNGDVGRWLPVSEALLLSAARYDHVQRTILPALAQGQWVLCDRFADSTSAYQGDGHGLDKALLAQLRAIAVGSTQPDLTLILDIDPAIGLARAAARNGGEDRYEQMKLDFHHRLRAGYLAIAAAEPERCAIIDAAQGIDAIQAAIRQTVRDRLGGLR